MALTVSSAFNQFLSNVVNLTAVERLQGETSHNYMRSILDQQAAKDEDFPRLLTGDFLSGSFARKTKLRPLNDIDIMIILDGQGLFMCDGYGNVTAEAVRGSGKTDNPLLNGNYYVEGTSNISSIKVLNSFKTALQARYPNTTGIRRDGQVVNVYLGSYGLGLDVVPAIEFLPEGADRPHYYIPSGKNSPTWMATNPKIDREMADGANKDWRHLGMYKPAVRLAKYWNATKNAGRLGSFHLEVICYNILASQVFSDFATAMKLFFDVASVHISQPCADPKGFQDRLDEYLSDEHRKLSQSAIDKALGHVWLATMYEAPGNHKEAITEWRRVFGDAFPEFG